MKNLLTIALAAVSLWGTGQANAQTNCNSLEIKLNRAVASKNYTQGYPILTEALNNCADKKINFYNFGESVLVGMIESTQDSTKYGNELIDLIDKRLANFPNEKKDFWKGEQITYKRTYNLASPEEIYKEYQELFTGNEGSETAKLSANTVMTYYTTSLGLMNEGKIDFEEALDVYFQTKKVAEDNIELRSIEYGQLAEKLDSLKQANPNNDLSGVEKQKMNNAQSAKDVFIQVNESMESVLSQYTTCDNITPMFVNRYEENKDSIEWLTGSYQALAAKDCYDNPIMEKIEARYATLYREQNPQATVASNTGTRSSGGSAIASSYGSGVRKFKAGNFSGAINDFKQAMNEVSGTTRGDVAYYLALSYQKTGSLSNAVSWAKKSANYKPGYGAPYQLIASIFASNANSCGSNQFQKLAAYWVAADFANKACSVDSRSCSWSRKAVASYEATAPNSEMIFSQGKKKGQRVSVSCFGGASTRIR